MVMALAAMLGTISCGLASNASSGGTGSPGGPTPSSQLTSSSTAVSFGNVAVGTLSTQSVTLTDSGTANVVVSSISTSGGGFTASGGSNVTLTPNQSLTITVNFDPATTGTAQGKLSITSDASNSHLALNLSGTGMAKAPASSQLTASSTSLSFGSVTVGAPAGLNVALTNIGTANVTITGVSATGSGFSASGGTNVTLAPNQMVNVSVSFNPKGAGGVQGDLSISSNASNSVLQIGLSGTGVAQVAVHKVTLNWQPSVSSVVGYFVYRGTSADSLLKLSSTVDQSTSYTDGAVPGGQTYYYAVTAVGSGNVESSPSSPISVIVPN
jgi:Abnormal spindle-like microcephaly-assoc'd, ASPM-SPD-2-Hydin